MGDIKDNFLGILKRRLLPIFAIILLIVSLMSSAFTVNEGSIAIVTRFGKVVGIREAGLNFKFPFIEKKVPMRIREQTIKFGENEEFPYIVASTKDMQKVALELTVSNITTDPMKVYKSFTGRQLESMLLPRIKDAVQTNISKYTIEEFVSQRAKLSKDIFDEIKDEFEPYGIVITNVSITNHKFSEVYENAVEEKKAAEQGVEKEKALQERKIIEQESKVKIAELKVKEREMEAKANKVETESITPELLNKWWLEKWDGKLPKVSGSNQGLMLPSDIFDESNREIKE